MLADALDFSWPDSVAGTDRDAALCGDSMGDEEKMKSMIVAVIATVGMTIAGTAAAQADLAQKNCGSCHAVDTKKMGPSFKDIAKKFKGNATAQADLVAKVGGGKGHPAVKASPDDLNNIMKWVLAQ